MIDSHCHLADEVFGDDLHEVVRRAKDAGLTRALCVLARARARNASLDRAAGAVRDFADVLTNWYVRRSRERFWAGDDRDAIDTLYTVLETLARVAAPLAPLVTEEVWRGLTGGESVHLTDWPDAADSPADDALVVDTTGRTVEAVVNELAAIVREGLA